MARVKYYDQASHEWKYADAALNMKGKDGYTPQKGIDYFTEEDVRELTENVLDQGVLTYNEQELTEDQKAQARENIGIDQISFDKLTEDLDASGFRITNLPMPQSGSEPATKDFVENFTIEGSTYVATDDGEGNVTIRPYLADEDELVFKSHIQNQNNPHGVTAAQVKARPDTWMPTAAEVGAATPEELREAVRKAAPRNLLDNSDWRVKKLIVNQKGQDSYVGTAGYTIDRWFGNNNTSKVTIKDNCVNLSAPDGTLYVTQYLSDGTITPGKKYTAAVHLVDGTTAIASGEAAVGMSNIAKYVNDTNGNQFSIRFGYNTDKNCFFAQFATSATVGHDIEWFAFYEGEYTKDTLPEYQSKGYENELMICRQYDPNTGEYIGLRKFGQPMNLLDNSDFTNPINQRNGYYAKVGATYYSDTACTTSAGTLTVNIKATYVNTTYGSVTVNSTTYYIKYEDMVKGYCDSAYAIDRWRSGSGITIALKSNYIESASTGQYQYFYQIVTGVAGKKLTFAVNLNCTSACVRMFSSDFKTQFASVTTNRTDDHIAIATATIPTNISSIAVMIYPGFTDTGGTSKIYWAALYEGEYTLETIPEYQPKGYGVELAECQRYFMKLGAGYSQIGFSMVTNETSVKERIFIPLPVTMRVAPTAIFDDFTLWRCACTNGSASITSQPTTTQFADNGVNVMLDLNKAPGHGMMALHATAGGTFLNLNADL